MPSPGQQSRHISYDNPGLLTRAGLHQSHSPVSTDKTCRLSSEMLLLLLSHLFFILSSFPVNHGSPPRKLNPRSRPGAPTAGSNARVHGPTAIHPAGQVGSLLGPSCWAEMGAGRGLQGLQSGRADKTQSSREPVKGTRSQQAAWPAAPKLVTPCGHPRGAAQAGASRPAPEIIVVAPSQT